MEASTRIRACRQCRHAKTGCSLDTPLCTRCEHRKLPCIYENKRVRRNPPKGSFYHSWAVENNISQPDALRKQTSQSDGVDHAANVPGTTESTNQDLSPAGFAFDEDFSVNLGWDGKTATWSTGLTMPEVAVGSTSTEHEQNVILDLFERELEDYSSSTISRRAANAETYSKMSLMTQRGSRNMIQALDQQSFLQIREKAPNLLSRLNNTKVFPTLVSKNLWATTKSYALQFADTETLNSRPLFTMLPTVWRDETDWAGVHLICRNRCRIADVLLGCIWGGPKEVLPWWTRS